MRASEFIQTKWWGKQLNNELQIILSAYAGGTRPFYFKIPREHVNHHLGF